MQLSSLSPCYSSGSQPGNGPTHNKDDSVHLHYHGQDNPTPPCPEPTSEVILDPVSLTTVTITSGNISASGVGKKEYGQHFGSLLGHLLVLWLTWPWASSLIAIQVQISQELSSISQSFCCSGGLLDCLDTSFYLNCYTPLKFFLFLVQATSANRLGMKGIRMGTKGERRLTYFYNLRIKCKSTAIIHSKNLLYISLFR